MPNIQQEFQEYKILQKYLNAKPERHAHIWQQSQLKNISQYHKFLMYTKISNLLFVIFELQNINIQSILIRHYLELLSIM